ncbi:DUF2721 domain-containing protein [Vacuolonema iberomarrocanum]|uniref:DUF2721 domain-containing protein n=1 Tax=Vacuolonema iberomarrocanum TaxID=3454632 RepID=UPI001A0672DC|nr:DUF2721 domain-containing protein [filamentous cyanobacterium LEGE 07170]
MSVEQTSQLLQLILNSVLMVAVCGVMLMGLLAHQGTLYQRLQWLNRECREQLMGTAFLERDRFQKMKHQQKILRERYRQVQNSIFLAYGALVALLFSTFLLACRTFLQVNSLIPGSLLFFVLGNIALLVSAGLALLDIQRERQSMLSELRDWMRGSDVRLEPPRLALPPSRERTSSRERSLSRERSPSREQHVREGRSRRRARVS